MGTRKARWISNQRKDEIASFRRKTVFAVFVGDPKGTAAYTVDQLERMDMVGVYTYDPPIERKVAGEAHGT